MSLKNMLSVVALVLCPAVGYAQLRPAPKPAPEEHAREDEKVSLNTTAGEKKSSGKMHSNNSSNRAGRIDENTLEIALLEEKIRILTIENGKLRDAVLRQANESSKSKKR